MKDFMLIFIGTNYEDLGLSPEEMQNRMGAWFGWQQQMEKDGVVKSGNALLPQTRLVVGADRTVTDKAATELKEIVGGYYIVQAEDFDGATKIAQGYPDYDLGGTVEIREVMHYDR